MSVQFQRNPQQIIIEPNLDDGQQHLQGPGRVSLDRSVSREERSERLRIRRIFDKYDTNRDGFLAKRELKQLIHDHPAQCTDIPKGIAKAMLNIHDTNNDGQLDFEEFFQLSQQHQWVVRDFAVRYCKYLVPSRDGAHADETDGAYESQMTFFPPPLTMVIFSIIEVIFFAVDIYHSKDYKDGDINSIGTSVNGPAATLFIYNPRRRDEAWRFVTYMFVHVGVMHILMNLIVQLFLGVALELVHHWWRVALVYIAGVAAGSMGTRSVGHVNFEISYLSGASGGIYAMIIAHVTSVLMDTMTAQYYSNIDEVIMVPGDEEDDNFGPRERPPLYSKLPRPGKKRRDLEESPRELEYPEPMTLTRTARQEKSEKKRLIRIFRSFDKNNDGFLENREVKNLIISNPDEFNDMSKALSKATLTMRSTSRMSFQQFVNLIEDHDDLEVDDFVGHIVRAIIAPRDDFRMGTKPKGFTFYVPIMNWKAMRFAFIHLIAFLAYTVHSFNRGYKDLQADIMPNPDKRGRTVANIAHLGGAFAGLLSYKKDTMTAHYYSNVDQVIMVPGDDEDDDFGPRERPPLYKTLLRSGEKRRNMEESPATTLTRTARQEKSEKKRLRKIFRSFDKNHDGFLEKREVKSLITSNPDEFEDMSKALSKAILTMRSTSRMSFQQFLNLIEDHEDFEVDDFVGQISKAIVAPRDDSGSDTKPKGFTFYVPIMVVFSIIQIACFLIDFIIW
ncbi:unnamed protein product [Diamesa hyperborea]